MKRSFFHSLAAWALLLTLGLALAACKKDGPQDEGEIPMEWPRTYHVTVEVQEEAQTPFTESGIVVDADLQDTGLLRFVFHQVKFSPNMPVRIDMVVNDVTFVQEGEVFKLSGNNLVPMAMGGPFPAYTITGLSGTLTDSKLDISMQCGKFPTRFLAE